MGGGGGRLPDRFTVINHARRARGESRDTRAIRSAGTTRLIVFSTPTGQPMTAFFPDDGTVLVRISEHEGFLFRHDDRIEDYWDAEPGAE